jgi:hypothetical protein
MKTLIIPIIVIFIIIAGNTFASQPKPMRRNFEINCEKLNKPAKFGDTLKVSWDFTLREETNEHLRHQLAQIEGQVYVRAFIKTRPKQEIISGDVEYRGKIEYYKNYAFETEIQTSGEDIIAVSVEMITYREIDGNYHKTSSNYGGAFAIDLRTEEMKKPDSLVYIDEKTGFTVISNPTFPEEILRDMQVEGVIEIREEGEQGK